MGRSVHCPVSIVVLEELDEVVLSVVKFPNLLLHLLLYLQRKREDHNIPMLHVVWKTSATSANFRMI